MWAYFLGWAPESADGTHVSVSLTHEFAIQVASMCQAPTFEVKQPLDTHMAWRNKPWTTIPTLCRLNSLMYQLSAVWCTRIRKYWMTPLPPIERHRFNWYFQLTNVQLSKKLDWVSFSGVQLENYVWTPFWRCVQRCHITGVFLVYDVDDLDMFHSSSSKQRNLAELRPSSVYTLVNDRLAVCENVSVRFGVWWVFGLTSQEAFSLKCRCN